jgi:hypothetical protein
MLALVSALVVAWAEPSQPLPTPFPEARYQLMSAKSPFAVASAAAAPTAAPTPGFAAQLYVDGVAQIGKTDFVAIKSRDPDQQSVIFLEVGKSTDDGMRVDAVHWSPEMGKSTVDVSKAGEKATLIFDEQQMAKNAAQPAMPNQPGVRLPTLPGQGRQIGFPMQNGQFQGNRVFPNMQMPPGVSGPPGTPNGMQVRRRVHLIQSGQ